VYAESILQTCRLGVRLPAACVSGMTGADLTSRIERIVHGSSKPGGARWRRNLVFIAAGVAIVGPLAIGVLRPRALSAKTPAVDGARHGRPTTWSVTLLEAETQLSFKGFSGRDLIRYAYGDDSMRVVDGPEWIDTQSASIEAGPMGANEHETRAILQSVLERQFGLLVHKEVRDLPVYALTVADTPGPGLRPAGECFDVDAWRAAGFPPTWTRTGRPSCGDSRHSPFGFSFKGTTMAQMADRLGPPFIDRVVVDTTRLDGRFDVDFTFFMPFAALAAQHPAWGPTLLAAGVPSVSRAMHEQLGLLLQEATQPTEVLVIDRALQP
jgi:uncharacterized protein (TIGR03435 family)